MKRIAINTGGGDAPGLNAVIRAVVVSGLKRGWEVLGIRKGYIGLLEPGGGGLRSLSRDDVRGIAHLGGTILGTTNRGNPFEWPVGGDSDETIDRSDELVETIERMGIEALIAIGGDGSMKIAHGLAQKGVRIVGIPKTIDNDLEGTVATFGFQTAVAVAMEAIDRLHSTAEAHERVFTVEVMGRYTGWIALHAGVAGGADVILIPEIPFDIEAVCDKVREREAMGRHFSIVVVAEGSMPKGGEMVTRGEKEAGREVRLGGIGQEVADQIAERTGKECRTVVLGHLQRGGSPNAYDRLIAQRFGAAAIRTIERGIFDVMIALDPPDVKTIPLADAARRMKTVPLDGDTICTARDMGIELGDGEGC